MPVRRRIFRALGHTRGGRPPASGCGGSRAPVHEAMLVRLKGAPHNGGVSCWFPLKTAWKMGPHTHVPNRGRRDRPCWVVLKEVNSHSPALGVRTGLKGRSQGQAPMLRQRNPARTPQTIEFKSMLPAGFPKIPGYQPVQAACFLYSVKPALGTRAKDQEWTLPLVQATFGLFSLLFE